MTPLVGRQEEHPAVKIEWQWWGVDVVVCLGEVQIVCIADSTAIPKPHNLLPHLNPDWFYLSGTGLPRLS